MKIIELSKEQFNEFSKNHRYRNIYQTSNYGDLMNKHGFNSIYIGLMDNDKLIAATLILQSKNILGIKYGYAPRGFLLDFNNYPLLKQFTILLKRYFKNKKFSHIKIDTPIKLQEHNKQGDIIEGKDNNQVVEELKILEYEKLKQNMYFEALKPRFNAIVPLNGPSYNIYKQFNSETKNKIRNSVKKGIEVIQGTRDDIPTFYQLIKNKHSRKIEYYIDFFDSFQSNNKFEIYFARINSERYLKNYKGIYDEEYIKNQEINAKLQKNMGSNVNNIINKKLLSDKDMDLLTKQIIRATNIMKKEQKNPIIATIAVIKNDREAFMLIDGYDKKYKDFYGTHMLKWAIINKCSKEGYLTVNLNGITGDFDKKNKYYGLYKHKIGFNADVVEYIGEFDLVINPSLYHIYVNSLSLENKLKSIQKKHN